jgi:hypothetical protein
MRSRRIFATLRDHEVSTRSPCLQARTEARKAGCSPSSVLTLCLTTTSSHELFSATSPQQSCVCLCVSVVWIDWWPVHCFLRDPPCCCCMFGWTSVILRHQNIWRRLWRLVFDCCGAEVDQAMCYRHGEMLNVALLKHCVAPILFLVTRTSAPIGSAYWSQQRIRSTAASHIFP